MCKIYQGWSLKLRVFKHCFAFYIYAIHSDSRITLRLKQNSSLNNKRIAVRESEGLAMFCNCQVCSINHSLGRLVANWLESLAGCGHGQLQDFSAVTRNPVAFLVTLDQLGDDCKFNLTWSFQLVLACYCQYAIIPFKNTTALRLSTETPKQRKTVIFFSAYWVISRPVDPING